MNNTVITIKNESILTGFLLQKINNLLPNVNSIYSGIINNNSNIRIYKNVFFNNDTSVITFTNGKSFLDKNIYKSVKINPISFDNGISFNVNYNKNYDLGQYIINNSFPKTQLNINGNKNVLGLYLNNGQKIFWSDMKHGIAVNNFTTSDANQIPINLNNKTITYTGDSTNISNIYNGNLIISTTYNSCSANYIQSITISSILYFSNFQNINRLNIYNTVKNINLRNIKFGNISKQFQRNYSKQ